MFGHIVSNFDNINECFSDNLLDWGNTFARRIAPNRIAESETIVEQMYLDLENVQKCSNLVGVPGVYLQSC